MRIYFPPESFERLPPGESTGGERLRVVPRASIDVGKFFDPDEFPDLLRRTTKDIAVIGTYTRNQTSVFVNLTADAVSGSQKLRDVARHQVISLARVDVQFFESDYQPKES